MSFTRNSTDEGKSQQQGGVRCFWRRSSRSSLNYYPSPNICIFPFCDLGGWGSCCPWRILLLLLWWWRCVCVCVCARATRVQVRQEGGHQLVKNIGVNTRVSNYFIDNFASNVKFTHPSVSGACRHLRQTRSNKTTSTVIIPGIFFSDRLLSICSILTFGWIDGTAVGRE